MVQDGSPNPNPKQHGSRRNAEASILVRLRMKCEDQKELNDWRSSNNNAIHERQKERRVLFSVHAGLPCLMKLVLQLRTARYSSDSMFVYLRFHFPNHCT